MILRRVIEHVKAQNWTAIALDFVIVVMGVFIGLQVNNWNEMRRNSANEARYRAELAEDLKADIAEFDETVGAAIDRAAAAKRLLDALHVSLVINHQWISNVPAGILVDRQNEAQRSLILRDLGHTRVLDGQRSTFDELVNTGNIGVLKDRKLIRTLARYYAMFQSEQDGDEINRHFHLALLDYYSDHGLNQFEEAPFELLVDMAEDPAFLGHVKSAYSLGLWQISRTLRLKTEAERALSLVEANEEGSASR